MSVAIFSQAQLYQKRFQICWRHGCVFKQGISSGRRGQDQGVTKWCHFPICFLFFCRTALNVIQQMQQMQMQMQQVQLQGVQLQGAPHPAPPQVVSAAPTEAAPNPTHEVAPTQEAGIKDEDQWWYQGPRFCLKCKTKSYLRQNICFNMNCVPWINVVWLFFTANPKCEAFNEGKNVLLSRRMFELNPWWISGTELHKASSRWAWAETLAVGQGWMGAWQCHCGESEEEQKEQRPKT